MNKREKQYIIDIFFINHINHEEKQAIDYNWYTLLNLYHTNNITKKVFDECLKLIKTNKYSNIIEAQDILKKSFGFKTSYDIILEK